MVKQNAKILTAVKVISDILCVIFAFATSWFLKFVVQLNPEHSHLPFSRYLELLWVSLPLFFFMQNFTGMYKSRRIRSGFKEFYFLGLNASVLFVAITVYLFVFKIYDISRALVGLFCVTTFLYTALVRGMQALISRTMRKRGFNLKHVVLVGLSYQGKSYLRAIKRQKHLGYLPFGFLDSTQTAYGDFTYLGKPKDLDTVLNGNYIDEVVLALTLDEYGKLPALLEICEKNGVKSVIIPTYTEFMPAKPQIDEIDDIPLVNTRYIPLDNLFFAAMKYTADFVISLTALVLLSPLMGVLALLVKNSSPGPVFFCQERVGFNKKTFKIYKFRTMRCNDGGWTVEDDPRVTKIGKFLRKTSLDELPQLINVLKGEMSLVGPRPEQTAYVEQFRETIPKYMLKHRVRPGITGWAQVHGLRGDTSIEDRIKHDIYYIENWNLFLDIKILILTIFCHRGY